MEGRDLLRSDSELEEEELQEEIEESSTKRIRLLRNLTLKIVGEATGTQYIFNGAGSVVAVDSEDVDQLMQKNKNQPNSCCGGKVGKVFELIE